MIGVYKIESPIGEVYIGQSWNIEKRFNKDYRNSNLCKNQRKLSASFNTHGLRNHSFNVIHELPADVDQFTMDRFEQVYIQSYKDAGVSLLNIRGGGSRGRHSKETIDIMKSKLGKWMIGKKDSEETKKKKSNAKKGVPKPPRSKEHGNNISSGNIGKDDTPKKPLLQFDLNGVFIAEWPSGIEAAKGTNQKSRSNIAACCNGKRIKAGGFIWKHKTN